jgi:hypothetical protein
LTSDTKNVHAEKDSRHISKTNNGDKGVRRKNTEVGESIYTTYDQLVVVGISSQNRQSKRE